MKILLLYPEMPDTFWTFKHFAEVVGKKATYPPLGLMTISALLPKNWERRLLDMNAQKLKNADLDWADYVFISAMNVQENSVKAIIQRCQARGVKIVGGGSLFTHEHERFPEIDYFILNEGELTLPQFIEDLEKGKPQQVYASKKFADMHQTPIPDFGLINMDNYLYAIIQYSRGCPYLCDFCDVTALFGRKPRTKTSTQIIEELEFLLAENKTQMILFADDNLIGNKRILKSDLLPALIDWRKKVNPPFFFATQLTINLADDDELMQLMLDAGFRHIFIGIETPDESALKLTRKNQNLKRNQLDNINKLHQAGFIVSAGFIVGFDTDDAGVFQRQADFIQESGIPTPIVNILKAPPGTELFDRMKREKRIIREFAFSEGQTNISLKMNAEVLDKGFRNLLDEIYLPKNVYQRLLTFLKTFQPAKTSAPIRQSFSWQNIFTIIRIVHWMVWQNPQGKYAWKMIYWCWKNKRKVLDQAFVYAIMMYQMFRAHHNMLEQFENQKEILKDIASENSLSGANPLESTLKQA